MKIIKPLINNLEQSIQENILHLIKGNISNKIGEHVTLTIGHNRSDSEHYCNAENWIYYHAKKVFKKCALETKVRNNNNKTQYNLPLGTYIFKLSKYNYCFLKIDRLEKK